MQFSIWRRHTAISRQASCLTNIFVILAVVVTGCTAYGEALMIFFICYFHMQNKQCESGIKISRYTAM